MSQTQKQHTQSAANATIQVALLQHKNQGNAHDNLSYLTTQIEQAGKNGCQLVVLQELHNQNYFCQQENPDFFDLAETIPGPSTELLCTIAKKHKLIIVGSIFEKRLPGVYHNTAVVIDVDGSIAGLYRKMHIPDDPGYYEKYYFTPGDPDLRPIKTSLLTLGVQICWDQWFPESARLLALAGAQVLIFPSAIGWNPR